MSVASGLEAQIKNIEAQYGKPIAAWLEIVRKSGLKKHTDVVTMLKTKHGLAHGAAHRIGLLSRAADPAHAPPAGGADAVASLYAGKKAPLLPIHEKLIATISAFGDFESAPKSGYVSLRRKKQFAMLKPAANHVDVGLILPGVDVTDRLESAAKLSALFTHRVRVSTVKELNKELVGWLRAAYERAG
jgi:hypothetical protein